jgi:hypothetical protein
MKYYWKFAMYLHNTNEIAKIKLGINAVLKVCGDDVILWISRPFVKPF